VLLNFRFALGILYYLFSFSRQCIGVCARDCAVLICHLQFIVFVSRVSGNTISEFYFLFVKIVVLSEFISVYEIGVKWGICSLVIVLPLLRQTVSIGYFS
jgi:hypothetical protein